MKTATGGRVRLLLRHSESASYQLGFGRKRSCREPKVRTISRR